MFAGLAQVVACEILSSDRRNIELIPGWLEYECGLASWKNQPWDPEAESRARKWPLLLL